VFVVQACRPCDALCDGCSGPSSRQCHQCTGYQEPEGDCVESCSEDFYTDETTKRCIDCDHQCQQCRGPTAADCLSCRYRKLYDDLEDRTSDSIVSHATDHFLMG